MDYTTIAGIGGCGSPYREPCLLSFSFATIASISKLHYHVGVDIRGPLCF
jgi:hypothetical protein